MSYVTEDEIAELLKEPDDYQFHGSQPWGDELGTTWGWGPIVDSRDTESIRARANAEALRKILEAHDDWDIVRAGHWGCGWVEQLMFKVIERIETPQDAVIAAFERDLELIGMSDDSAALIHTALADLHEERYKCWVSEGLRGPYVSFRPTKVCQAVMDWRDVIKEYVVYDDEIYYQILADETREQICEHLRRIELCPAITEDYVLDLIMRERRWEPDHSDEIYVPFEDVESFVQEHGLINDSGDSGA